MGNDSLTLNFTSHQIVFQLADTLNELNNHKESLNIDWISFFEKSDNRLYYI